MTFRTVIALFTTIATTCLALHPASIKRGTLHGFARKKTVRQEMFNYGDVAYAIDFKIGGQAMKSIPDTGSFDLLVFSKQCNNCGDVKGMYDHLKSEGYVNGTLDAVQVFGSGMTKSWEAFDTVEIEDIQAQHQAFWEVHFVHGFQDSPLQSILGVGPPASSRRIAEKEAKEIEDETAAVADDNSLAAVQKYEDVAQHARQNKPFLSTVQMSAFSVCLGATTGSPGMWVWNDDALHLQPDLFTTHPVVGDLYWSVNMRNVKFASTNTDDTPLGCDDEKGCSAVIDTGTSLLAVPTETYDAILNVVDKIAETGDVCNDFTGLPDLVFQMGSTSFSLGPEAYIGHMTGELPEAVRALMPRQRFHDLGDSCTPLLMTIDEMSDDGPVWILGLPFFRKYYTTFTLNEESTDGSSVSFAVMDNCNSSQTKTLTRLPSALHDRKMRVDASKIRVPAAIRRQPRQGASELRRRGSALG